LTIEAPWALTCSVEPIRGTAMIQFHRRERRKSNLFS
jgi:hypothetical protein